MGCLCARVLRQATWVIMSWQDYVNTQLVSKGVKEGAIAGKDGNIWAKSDTFALTVDEVKVLAEKFDSGALAGQKYFYLSTDEDGNVLRGKQGKGGVHVMRTGQTILMGVYEEPMAPAQAATITESLGDYLKNAGF